MDSDRLEGSKAWISLAAWMACFMSVLDIHVVNVALSDIQGNLAVPLDQISWVSTSYLMASVIIIPMTGWLQRRFGARRYFVASILLFSVSSVLCGLSWNFTSLVVLRGVQGLGGGALIPSSQAILFARYPRPEHGKAGAIFGLGTTTGGLLGPIIGGFLVDRLSWHWMFFVNLPLGLLCAWIAWRNIEQPNYVKSEAPADSVGIALLAIGMIALQFTLEEGNRDGWFSSTLICITAVVTVIVFLVFIVHELETEHPVIDLRVLRNSNLAVSVVLNLLLGMTIYAGNFLISLFSGVVLHLGPIDIGMIFLEGMALQLLMMPLAGRLVGKFDIRKLIAFGIVMNFGYLLLLTQVTSLSSSGHMVLSLVFRSVGLGFMFAPLSVLALSELPLRQRGTAAGLYNLTRELGGSIGTAWMSTLVVSAAVKGRSTMAAHVSRLNEVFVLQLHSVEHGLLRWSKIPHLTALKLFGARVHQQALVYGFVRSFFVLTFLFLISFALIAMAKRLPRMPPGPAPAGRR